MSLLKNFIKCKECSREFIPHHHNVTLCSKECKHQNKRKIEVANRHKKSLLKYSDGSDPYNYCECKLCGFRSYNLGTHPISHNMTVDEYITQYGPVHSQKAIDDMKGDKNPAYHHGGKYSAHSKRFTKYTGLSELETSDAISRVKIKGVNTKLKNNNDRTKIEYYTSRGMSIEEANIALSDRQRTFSLEICINKHGTDKGREVWTERQLKWSKSYKKQNFSKISQLLFDDVVELYDSPNIHFATKDKLDDRNQEYRLKLRDGSLVLPDFICLDTKRIIEFDGDYWHSERVANPSKERNRDERIIDSGYSILHIKECDFKKHKQRVIDECITFLKQ